MIRSINDNILFDTNIILDFILHREPFFEASNKVLNLAFDKIIIGFVSASTITDLYYIIRKSKNKEVAKNFITDLIEFIEVADVNKEIILQALKSKLNDFEDSVQEQTASIYGIQYIVTRNIDDYKQSIVEAILPCEFLQRMKQS
ncbi:MAG: PIN domain-containing protein [Candidatus Cloacimonetes bacterium]|nr:PIN domain-containing protein [Candidatus Cloacimonadota bacterium]